MGFWDSFKAVGNAAGALSGNAAGSRFGGGGMWDQIAGRPGSGLPSKAEMDAQWASMTPEQRFQHTDPNRIHTASSGGWGANPGAQQVAPTFTTPVQGGGMPAMGIRQGDYTRPTSQPGMMGPNGHPMIPPGPNQSQFPGQQNPNAPYAGINTGGGQYPLSSVQGTGFLAPFNAAFNRPDPNQIAQDPSFKFQMEQGTEALERSALARGTALSGGAAKELSRFGQGLASTFDDKYYGRAKGEYDTARDIFNQNKQSQYGVLADQRNAGQQAATNQAEVAAQQGNAQAAGTVRQGSVYGNLVNNAGRLGAATYDQWDYNRQQNANAQPNLNPFVQQGPYQFPGQQYTMGQNPGRQWAGPTDPYQQYLT